MGQNCNCVSIATNGQTTNGQTTNGQTTNGQTTNGQTTNGQTTNGQTTNGQTTNGQTTNGQMVTGSGSTNQSGPGQGSGDFGGQTNLDANGLPTCGPPPMYPCPASVGNPSVAVAPAVNPAPNTPGSAAISTNQAVNSQGGAVVPGTNGVIPRVLRLKFNKTSTAPTDLIILQTKLIN